MFGRIAIFLYGAVAYSIFFGTFLYAIGFVENLGVPKSIDGGEQGPVLRAVVVNLSILGLFAVQHMIMARPGFKRWWTRIIPEAMERSTFVLLASLILILLFWQWRPINAVVWEVGHPVARALLLTLSLAGFAIVLYSSALIDHFDLFGLRQVWLHLRRRAYAQHPFMERSLYRLVRHPLMLGFLIAFWSAPTMTVGHLLFALGTTGYILIGTRMEERDLVALHGEEYEAYRRRTAMLVPWPKRGGEARVAVEAAA
jgi:protein-S-isoprenylcysteine O-methyltransferase Ste14